MGMANVGYVRISKDRVGAGLGVGRQKHDITERAAAEGVTIERWYVDNDMSAYQRRKKRPDYTSLMADLVSGVIVPGGRVWTWHTDRLHRNNAELEDWISAAHPRAIAVMTVKAGLIDLATPGGRLVARQLGAVAQYESEHKAERLKGKMAELARDGKYRGGPRPFGYQADGVTKDPFESKLVAEGVAMILDGKSLNAVCRAWQEAGAVRTVSKKPWEPNLVRGVLCRPRNAGLMEHNGVVVGRGEWEPLMSEEDHAEVVRILTDPTRTTHTPGNQPRWLGSNFYKCGLEGCGYPLVVGVSGGGKGRKPGYSCTSGRRGELTSGRVEGAHVGRQAEAVDELISALVVEYLSDPETQAALVVQSGDGAGPDVGALRREAAQIENDQAALADDVGAGLISREQMHRMNAGYQARLSVIERQLADAAATASPAARMAVETDVQKAWDAAPIETKRAVVRELMVVTILPAPKGQRTFQPEYVKVEWVGGGLAA